LSIPSPIYYNWKVQFAVVSRCDEKELFKKIKNTFSCGEIYCTKDGKIRYSVQHIDDLSNTIIPFPL